MTPTRIPPGWTFWPISGHLSSESCSPAAKRPARKDAGSARSQWLRARLRTRRDGALQRPGECEADRWGPTLDPPPLLRADTVVRLRRHVADAEDLEARGLQ